MRIAVIGARGVGGYFGGKLAQAGNDVTFVARAGECHNLCCAEAVREWRAALT